ncbi:response regulator transcription factor [Paenibacillus pini]|uniref:Helix-turn-helix n=1 Tax=Paenibacillus pini JCM 16418 TaxID=1236976 RepID=W7YI13_9BACL|nr:response regulator [Paenibacillus pini]GAF07248.1 helix-turn-helix [Paenibacillus pini JCM 16418]
MLKVLLVDDEAPILNNLNKVIQWTELNMEVMGLARSGQEALALCEQQAPDIVLSDIRMPVMDGLTFISELRQRGCTAEVLLLTGYQEFEYARLAIKYKVRDYICKPIHYKELENTLRLIGDQLIRSRKLDPLQFAASHLKKQDTAESAKKSSQQLIADAITYIMGRLDKDLGIEELAGHLGISCSYFCLLFKNHVGITFVEYLTNQRIEAAKYLLTHSDKSVTQIGAGIGYHERRYFTKVFQRYTGMTPSEYREQVKDCSVS